MINFTPYKGLNIDFSRLAIKAAFTKPHTVLSSCRVNGGMRADLGAVCNHQACEPAEHMNYLPESACSDPVHYLNLICRRENLPQNTALLTTAASVQCAGVAQEHDNGITVYVICTAGVEGNAARAGDAATYRESEQGIEILPDKNAESACSIKPKAFDAPDTSDTLDAPNVAAGHPGKPGTINIMCFISHALTPAALLEAAMLATEAKSAVLQELLVPSLYSPRLATGTGTDQIAIAAANFGQPLQNAGKHCKLGQMIGQAVRRAMYEGLARQNNLTPVACCKIYKLLGRFGADKNSFIALVQSFLTADKAKLFAANYGTLLTDPVAVSATAALIQLADLADAGVISALALAESRNTYAALIACAVSGNDNKFAEYKSLIAQKMQTSPELANNFCHKIASNHKITTGPESPNCPEGLNNPENSTGPESSVTVLAAIAVALGFADKWPEL